MTDKNAEQTREQPAGTDPWWSGYGALGAVGLILVGVAGAAWMFFRLPGTPEDLTPGYHQAVRVFAIGMVIAGTALLSRLRNRGATAEEDQDQEQEAVNQ